MHLHYRTLQRQAAFLNKALQGIGITGSFTGRKNEWLISLEEDGASLRLSTDARYPFVVQAGPVKRPKNAATLMAELVGRRFESITLLPDDRIFRCSFQNSDLILYLQLFGARSNFFLLNSDRQIVNAFKNSRKYIGSIFELRQSQPRPDPLAMDTESFQNWLTEHAGRSLESCLKLLKDITRPLVAEIAHRAGISLDEPAASLAAPDQARLLSDIQKLLDQFSEARPCIYYRDEHPQCLTLGEFQSRANLTPQFFDTVNKALRTFGFQRIRDRELGSIRERCRGAIERRLKSVRHALEQLNQPPDESKKERMQRIGELLSGQPHLIKAGQKTVELVDYFDPDLKTITVTVDPALGAAENAQKYFHKAQQLSNNKQKYLERRRELEIELALLESLQAELIAAGGYKDLLKIEEALKQKHMLPHAAEKADKYQLPYKKIEFQGFEIWVGKNARANDQMTFGHAAKHDLWLHVQGYSGAHVIVRNPARMDNLPQRVIEYAARVAVSNSAAKHAQYLPVIYTEVRHVRKPRKSAPGSVLPERLKTIFADPL